jgi:hypothetical protein
MSISPTMRTLEYLRNNGYQCDMVERWIRNPKHPAGGFRKDFLGCIDIIAFNNLETVGVQSCGQSFSQHLKDLLINPNIPLWLAGGRKFTLIGWRRLLKKRGGKQKIWVPRIREITPKDFNV